MPTLHSFGLQNLSVLVVERDRFAANLIQTILHTFGITKLHFAFHSDEVLEFLSLQQPNLIITEYKLKGCDTIDMVRQIRSASFEPYQHANILMITGIADLQTVKEARDAGITEFLAKPVTGYNLYNRICSMIAHPRPFTDCPVFKGPERRRRKQTMFPDRRSHDELEIRM
ncbi:response regulator [Terasakiella sp. SH-1]|uniref:response regulator n=1 Tax=Terasakiella sp. SH-1 TaxID=2560057 RepID=UPI00107414E7|nr:response regulator [Terasakiella sp. SH-1]